MSYSKRKFGVDEMPRQITVLGTRNPGSVLEKTNREFEKLGCLNDVYGDANGNLVAAVYGAAQTADTVSNAMTAGVENVNIAGFCAVTDEEKYEPGDIIEPKYVWGKDGLTNYEGSFKAKTDEFEHKGLIDDRTSHVSVPSVNHVPDEVEKYIQEQEIDTVEMEVATALKVAKDAERDVNVTAALSVIDPFNKKGVSWENYETEEAVEVSRESVAEILDNCC